MRPRALTSVNLGVRSRSFVDSTVGRPGNAKTVATIPQVCSAVVRNADRRSSGRHQKNGDARVGSAGPRSGRAAGKRRPKGGAIAPLLHLIDDRRGNTARALAK